MEMCVNHMKKITNNDSHAHDDIADTCSDAVRIALMDKLLHIHTHKDALFRSTTQEATSRLNRLSALKKKAYEKRI
jgi:hypothetical protein